MYVSTPEQPFAAGSDVPGIPAPSTNWFFAEGATGPFFDFFLLLANPQPTDASEHHLRHERGGTFTKVYPVAASSRTTISVQQENEILDNAAIAATVTSTCPNPAECANFWSALPVGQRRARVGWLDRHGDALGAGRWRGGRSRSRRRPTS